MAPLLYGVLARGGTILCSHTKPSASVNFDEVVKSMLPNIPANADAKTTYTSHNYMFHVMVQNGLTVVCTTEAEANRRQPYAFCSEIHREITVNEWTARAKFAKEWDLQADVAPTMAQLLETYSKEEQRPDKLTQLRAQVDEVKDVMTVNIERVLERGERLDDLLEKTTELESSANTFAKTAKRVHRNMWWKNMRMKIIIGVIVLVVLLVLILIILFSTGVLPVKDDDKTTTATTATTTTSPA